MSWPLECRERARRWATLSEEAHTPEVARLLMDLSVTWLRIADEAERLETLMDENAALQDACRPPATRKH